MSTVLSKSTLIPDEPKNFRRRHGLVESNQNPISGGPGELRNYYVLWEKFYDFLTGYDLQFSLSINRHRTEGVS